jgi:hypothetical protein
MRVEEEVLSKIEELKKSIILVGQIPDVRGTAKLELEQQLKALLWATNQSKTL